MEVGIQIKARLCCDLLPVDRIWTLERCDTKQLTSITSEHECPCAINILLKHDGIDLAAKFDKFTKAAPLIQRKGVRLTRPYFNLHLRSRRPPPIALIQCANLRYNSHRLAQRFCA